MALAISNGRTPWQHPVERDGFAGQQGGVGSGVLEPTSHIVLTNEAQPLVQLRYDGVYHPRCLSDRLPTVGSSKLTASRLRRTGRAGTELALVEAGWLRFLRCATSRT